MVGAADLSSGITGAVGRIPLRRQQHQLFRPGVFAHPGREDSGFLVQGAMSSRRRLRVSIIWVAASAPKSAIAANIRNTHEIPYDTIISPTTVGPAAEAKRSQH